MKKIIPFLLLLFAIHFTDMNAQATCDGDVISVGTTVQNGQVDNKHAGTSLTATNIIEVGGQASYKSGVDVTLSPGFHSKEGAEFVSLIEACNASRETLSADSEELDKERFAIYPNPTFDKLSITGYSMKDTHPQIKILDVSGRVVLNTKSQSNIDVSTLKSGVYFIQIIGENKITKKFIKM